MINYEVAFHQKPLGQKGISKWNMKHETFGIHRRKVGFLESKKVGFHHSRHWTYLNMGVSLTKMLILGWVNTNIKYVYLGNVGFCSPRYEPLKMAFRLWWISSGWDLTSQWPGVAAEGYDLCRGWIDHGIGVKPGEQIVRPITLWRPGNDGSPCQGFPVTKGSCRDTAQRNGYWNSSVQRWYLDGAGNLQLIWDHCWYFTSCTWSIFLLSRQFSPEVKGFGPDAWGSKTPKDRVWVQNRTRIERERWWDFLSNNKLSFVKDLELLPSGNLT